MFSVFKRENFMRLCFSSSSSESREFLFYDPTRCYSHVRACLYGRLKEHASWKLQSVASQPTLCYASSFSASYLLGYRPCAMSQLCPLHRLYCSNISLARSVKHKYDFHSSEFESDGHWILSLHGDQSILSTTILRQKATMHCNDVRWRGTGTASIITRHLQKEIFNMLNAFTINPHKVFNIKTTFM